MTNRITTSAKKEPRIHGAAIQGATQQGLNKQAPQGIKKLAGKQIKQALKTAAQKNQAIGRNVQERIGDQRTNEAIQDIFANLEVKALDGKRESADAKKIQLYEKAERDHVTGYMTVDILETEDDLFYGDNAFSI